jgi:hypothetical protein
VRVGIIQSSFIPWRGCFDFIASVDLFVFHDDIQYTKGDWRNRNRIKTAAGVAWLTVPVSYKKVSQKICETPIVYSKACAARHSRIWRESYQNAPFVDVTNEILFALQPAEKDLTISEFNIRLIRGVCSYLGITTRLALSSEFDAQGTKTDRLIDILTKAGATTYLSGPSADGYLDKEMFRSNGIQLEYKTYDYAPYPQLWGDFVGEVTVLDLIANCGPQSRSLITSRSPDVVVASRS